MAEYVLGIDGGGTKTTIIAADLEGNVLGSLDAGAININGEAQEVVKANLKQLFRHVSEYYGGLNGCRSVCVGAAGVSNMKTRLVIEDTIREAGYRGPLSIRGDHETALHGALGSTSGIILIAGTGSICYGRNASGEEHRTGGFGYLIDDEGSGYAIGRDMLGAIVREADGRGEKTILSEMVYKQLDINSIEELTGFLYSKNTSKRNIAALAVNLPPACALGDRVALGIAEKCSCELIKLVCPVVERLKLQNSTIAMSGSILQKDGLIQSSFVSGIAARYPGLDCRLAENSAAYGAVSMALDRLKTGSM